MLINITEKDFKYLYHFREEYVDNFHGIQCRECKSKINYLRKKGKMKEHDGVHFWADEEWFVTCPKCRFCTRIEYDYIISEYSASEWIKIEQPIYEYPDFGLSKIDIINLWADLDNHFEYMPGVFKDDEEFPLDSGLRFWYTD